MSEVDFRHRRIDNGAGFTAVSAREAGNRAMSITSVKRLCTAAGLCVSGLLLTAGNVLRAESAYVTDQLQLGVHQLPDASDRAFAKLRSGDEVEILETTRFHALVRMSDGRQGWAKKAYLVDEKPAVLRVSEVERERDQALSELESLTQGLGDREARVAEMEARAAERADEAAAERTELERLRSENADLSDRLDAYALAVPGSVFIVAAIASFIIGLLGSWWWFDRRSRARHGGFRIY